MLENDPLMRKLLSSYKRIAVVGLSPKPARPSNQVARFLIQTGYQVIPVNPGQEVILERKCFPDLLSIPEPVEIVNVFRNPQEVPAIVAQAIAIKAKALWLQLAVVHEEAAREARLHGIEVVMDRCIQIEHLRLFPKKP